MHDNNYDKNDPRCIKYSHVIKSLEDHRENFQNRPDSKFFSKKDELQKSLHKIYRFLKSETGYAPVWLFNALDAELNNKGRKREYSRDDRIFNSKFVHMIVTRGCSQAQAINLLGLLMGKHVIEEGFTKEVRETYKEFQSDEFIEDMDDLVDCGELISMSLHFCAPNKEAHSSVKFDDALEILESICKEIIDYTRKNYHLLEKNDPAHPHLFAAYWEKIHNKELPILEYFYAQKPPEPQKVGEVGYAMRQTLYSIQHFREKNCI